MKRSPLQRKTPLKAGSGTLARSTFKRKEGAAPRAKFKVRKPSATAAEKRHMTAVAALGCVVCRNLGYGPTPAELHHPRDGAGAGQKSSNMDVIPLCPPHHRLGGYGIAYHAGPEEFERRYGTERQLLAQTLKELFRPKP